MALNAANTQKKKRPREWKKKRFVSDMTILSAIYFYLKNHLKSKAQAAWERFIQ